MINVDIFYVVMSMELPYNSCFDLCILDFFSSSVHCLKVHFVR